MTSPNHFCEIATNLLQFLEDGFLCDTVLVTETKELKAHSILLAAVSPIFRAAFEGIGKPGLQYIELSSFDSETVEIALKFIYTGKLLLSPQYAHVDNLYQLFGRLKDLGLEAQRLNGCEIRFLNDADGRKKNVGTPKNNVKNSSPSARTGTLARRKRTVDSHFPTVQSDVVQTNGRVKAVGEFDYFNNKEEEEVNLDDVGNISKKGPSRSEFMPSCATVSERIVDKEPEGVKTEYEEGCSLDEEIATGLEVPEEVQVVYSTTGVPDFVDNGLNSSSLVGFGLGDGDCNSAFSENLLTMLSTENNDEDVVRTGKSNNAVMKSLALSETTETHHLKNEVLKEDAELEEEMMEFRPDGAELVKVEALGDGIKAFDGKGYYVLLPADQTVESDASNSSTRKRFPCDVCGKLLTKKAMKAHCLIHTGERPFKCSVCGKSFTMATNLLRHSRLHTGLKPHLCHLCGKSFIQKVTLQDHLAIHLSEKKFKCSTCGKMFLKSKQLTQHNHEIHQVEYRPANDIAKDPSPPADGQKCVLCDLCGKSFVSKFGLKQHSKLHLEEKPFRCSHCEKTFLTKQNLVQHMLNHTGEKPYICKTCGIAYKRKHLLQWHEHIHTGEKPYICNTCGKGFAYSCSLKVHTRTHTGERPYQCRVCRSSYSQSNHLKVHMRTHTGEKPFVCEHCGKAYKNRLDLRLHSIRVHHINITKSRSAATNNNWQ